MHNICITPLAFNAVYMCQKSNYVRAFKCYKQKRQLVPL